MPASLFPLALSLLVGGAVAGDEVSSVEPEAVTSLVDGADAAQKKKSKKSSKQGQKSSGRDNDRSDDRKAEPRRDTESKDREGSAQKSEARKDTADREKTSTRRESVNVSTSARSSNSHASAERHESASRHAPANYRGHSDPDRTDRHASAARHAPAVRATAARHHAAVSHHAAASHHAAWVNHHGPHRWYSPWRPGVRVHWYHGVFVYGPPVVVVDGDGHSHVRREGEAKEAPKPQVERAGKFSLGVRGATYISDFYGEGRGYGDAGLGLAARYRIIDPLGIEAQWTYHDQSWSQETARIQQPLSLSAELFAFPWTKVNPYVLAGVTVTDRNIDQSLSTGTFETDQALWGPHGGVGLEFGVGKDVSLNFDARWIGYVNKDETDPAVPGAFQGNMGLNFYF